MPAFPAHFLHLRAARTMATRRRSPSATIVPTAAIRTICWGPPAPEHSHWHGEQMWEGAEGPFTSQVLLYWIG